MQTDATDIANSLSKKERAALLSLPCYDRGHMPDDSWWVYHTLLDMGLSTTAGNFLMVRTALGDEVLRRLQCSN